MNESILSLLSKSSYLISMVIILYTVGAFLLIKLTRQHKEENQSKIKKFFTILTTLIKEEGELNKVDVENFFKGLSTDPITNKEYEKRLVILLRQYLVETYEDESQKNDKVGVKTIVNRFIEDLQREDPYNELPVIERNLLNDIKHFLNSNNPKDVEKKLGELAVCIYTRHNEYTKSKKLNKRSIPIGVAGVLLSMVQIIQWFL